MPAPTGLQQAFFTPSGESEEVKTQLFHTKTPEELQSTNINHNHMIQQEAQSSNIPLTNAPSEELQQEKVEPLQIAEHAVPTFNVASNDTYEYEYEENDEEEYENL